MVIKLDERKFLPGHSCPFPYGQKIVARTLTRDLFTVVNILVIMYQPKAAEGGLGWGGAKSQVVWGRESPSGVQGRRCGAPEAEEILK